MCVFHVHELACAEPAKVIVLFRGRVVRLSSPLRDQKRVHSQIGVIDGHRDWPWIVDLDSKLLAALPADGLAWRFSTLEVTTAEPPGVRECLSPGVAVHHQNPAVADHCGRCDGNDHSGILAMDTDVEIARER